LNDGWVADFNNKNEPKFFIEYSEYFVSKCTYVVKLPFIFHYMESVEVADKIISEFGDDLKKYIFTN
jgi:hypothetical protein